MIKVITWSLAALVVAVLAFLLVVSSVMMSPVLAPLGLPLPDGCLRQTVQKTSAIRGLEFEVVDTACGFFGSVQWQQLHVHYLGKAGRTEIFRYMGDRLPTIQAIDQRTVLVSVELVDAIGLQKDKWRDWTILYDVRSTERPGG